MLKKIAILAAALVAVLALSAPAASAATTAADVPGLSIGEIGYNAHGADRSWNRNSEFIDVTNTSTDAVDVKGLRVEDAWAHGRGDDAGVCNNFTISELPGIAETAGKLLLPADHTVRVYVGSGEPKVFGPGLRWHAVYVNMDTDCGYYGHVLNNNPPKNKTAPWDTVWITKGGVSESKSYNFTNGYTFK